MPFLSRSLSLSPCFKFNAIMSARKVLINISSDSLLSRTRFFFLPFLWSFHEKLWCAINYSVSTWLFRLSFFRDTELFIFLKLSFPRYKNEKYFLQAFTDSFCLFDIRIERKEVKSKKTWKFFYYLNVAKAKR